MGILLLQYGDPKFLASLPIHDYDSITWSNYFMNNLLPVTIGNIIGGAGLVGLVYWFVFLRKQRAEQTLN